MPRRSGRNLCGWLIPSSRIWAVPERRLQPPTNGRSPRRYLEGGGEDPLNPTRQPSKGSRFGPKSQTPCRGGERLRARLSLAYVAKHYALSGARAASLLAEGEELRFNISPVCCCAMSVLLRIPAGPPLTLPR
jgi:hypothetical protein